MEPVKPKHVVVGFYEERILYLEKEMDLLNNKINFILMPFYIKFWNWIIGRN